MSGKFRVSPDFRSEATAWVSEAGARGSREGGALLATEGGWVIGLFET